MNHPSIELLTEYASGSLPLSHALCVAAHLEHCEVCQQQLSKLNALGASFFDEQSQHVIAENEEANEALKSKVFAMLDEQPLETATLNKVVGQSFSESFDAGQSGYRVPKSLRQFIPQTYDELSWTNLTPSLKVATLVNDKDGSQVALSRTKPGGRMAHHAHSGDEFTVVLEGSFSDETGIYHKGDFVHRNAHDKHQPIVTKDAECICLMVTDAPIQFTGFFTRWLNPLLRRVHPHG